MSQHPLRLLLDFDDCIRRDRDQPASFLHRRDRRFALDCQDKGISPTAEQWLQQRHRLSGSVPAGPDWELARWQRITSGFCLAGGALGVLAMTGLLFYDGGQRINITVMLAFVGFQLLLALFTTVQSMMGWQPWHWLIRRLRLEPATPARANLQPLLMARSAQAGGSVFAATALATLLLMVILQDLAFGWSTTLDTATGSYHALIRAIATPWAWLWPDAAPSQSLVEATRFFRAAPEAPDTPPAIWGQWWPFVVMLWFTWVLVPRLCLLALSHWLVRRRAVALLASHPGWQALSDRMTTPTVETGSDHTDASEPPAPRRHTTQSTVPQTPLRICWAGAEQPSLPGQAEADALRAGGRATLAEDEAVIDRIGQGLIGQPAPAVILFTRSWEPPTGELEDFLETARQQWPANTRVTLVPLATDAESSPADHLIQPWLRFAERQPDAFASVALPFGGGAPGRQSA